MYVHSGANDSLVPGMTSADMELEQQRRQWEDEWKDIELRKQEEARRDEKIEVCDSSTVCAHHTCIITDVELLMKHGAHCLDWCCRLWRG